MVKNLVKFTATERIVLAATGLLALGCLLWFALAPSQPVTFTGLGPSAAAGEVPEPEAPGMLEGEVLDLNTATLSDLTRLPGIGESRAQDILDWRTRNGGFASVEDLLEIRGIGAATLDKLRPYLTVGGEAGEAASQPAEEGPAGEKLDLNTATLAQLMELPGIGEVRAQAILDWRSSHGGFSSVEQLLEVKGIGAGILAQVSPYVTAGTAEEGGR